MAAQLRDVLGTSGDNQRPHVSIQSERDPLISIEDHEEERVNQEEGEDAGGQGLDRWFFRTVSCSEEDPERGARRGTGGPPRTLGTFPGVFSPVALSMFSTVLFLRLGFVVGQAGIIEALLQFLLAYAILYMTILSVCAISTNGAVEGGGAYFMISRALGPEFGGSIGFLFFLANIISCALYVSGCVEGLVANFGPGGDIVDGGLPGNSRWWVYLYATFVLFICLIICLIGASMFARTLIFIFLIVVVCTITVIISMLVKHLKCINYSPDAYTLPPPNNHTNFTVPCANFTGVNIHTFHDNVNDDYSWDYSSEKYMTFASVFAVLFSSVTGIMNGANMSGELKDPGKAIPRGTLTAATFTLVTYIILALITALTCSRDLLLNNYIYMQAINVWPPFVVIGIFAATMSAALGNLIGASRILEALARDQLFWFILKPATVATKGGNPIVAVLISWILVQLVLLIGSLNAISPLASVFFLLAYAATNMACLGMELASAPNFRPTFRFYGWHTCLLGLVGCVVMCFLINAVFASVAVIVCMLLVIVLHLRTFPTSWGSISQALIFHQVRKYLLMLDSRKDHVKFWRPQILLMVSNPRACTDLIEFINDLKKGGLYVLGHVKMGNFDDSPVDPCQVDYPQWLTLVDFLKIKAFIELTVASTVREGMHHLVRISGLGGMKPNTICYGFYDHSLPEDKLCKRKPKSRRRVKFYTVEGGSEEEISTKFPDLRQVVDDKLMGKVEYVHMIYDTIKMNKNAVLCRHFHQLDKDSIVKSRQPMFIDVWPLNLLRPDSADYFDNACLFMLQLACILNMVPGWKDKTILRVFLCVNAQSDDTLKKERKLDQLLRQLRIIGQIKIITWEHLICLLDGSLTESDQPKRHPVEMPEVYLQGINELIKVQCENTAVTFLYLPRVSSDPSTYEAYIHNLEVISNNLPPTVFVHGLHPVTSTTL